jgi:hypothetical protein
MQYTSFLDLPADAAVQVIFKVFHRRKVALMSGAFREQDFRSMDDAAIRELVSITSFERLICGAGDWMMPGSQSMLPMATSEFFRRGGTFEERQPLFSHALALSDAALIGPEAMAAQAAA